MRASVVEGMTPCHAEGEDRPEAEASAQAEGEECSSHYERSPRIEGPDQPSTRMGQW